MKEQSQFEIAAAKYESARADLVEHEKAHYLVNAEYNRSYKKLEELNRDCATAWTEMKNAQ